MFLPSSIFFPLKVSAGAYGTPIRKVLATAIQSPLLISNKSITFSLPPTLDCPTPPVQHQNVSPRSLIATVDTLGPWLHEHIRTGALMYIWD